MTCAEDGFAAETAAHTAAFLLLKAGRAVSRETLGHWLYLAEREHAKLRGHAIFDDTWLATEDGPTCHHALRGLAGLSEHRVWAQTFATSKNELSQCRDDVTLDSLDHLSEAIIITCDTILRQYGACSDENLVDLIRYLPENRIFKGNNTQIGAHAMALSVGLKNPDAFVEMNAESRSIRRCFADIV